MKIAMILDSTFPPDPRVENEALTLIEHGVHIDLYCLTYDKNEPTFEEKGGIQIHRIFVPGYFRSISALAYTVPFYHLLLKYRLKRIFDPLEYDAIHIHDMQSARAVFWMTKNYTGRLVLDLHENRPAIMQYYEHVRTWPGRFLIYPRVWQKFEKKYIHQVAKVIVVTDLASKYYQSLYNEDEKKFVVVPNSVKKEFYTNLNLYNDFKENYKDKFVLLYLGDTGTRRGIFEVLKAIKLLKEEIPEIIFLSVGKSKSDVDWEKYIEANDLKKNVTLLGWQEFTKFPALILASDICLSPLHKNLHHDTTYANKLFQYMSLKKAVIVSNCEAQKKVVENWNCGMVFEAGNSYDLAEKIKTLYYNYDLRRKLGENGYKAIESEFTWEKISKNLVDMYVKK